MLYLDILGTSKVRFFGQIVNSPDAPKTTIFVHTNLSESLVIISILFISLNVKWIIGALFTTCILGVVTKRGSFSSQVVLPLI